MTTSAQPHIVSIDEIREAAERIRGVATRTPLLRWDDTTWLKPESLQPVGAFKMRGAYNKIASLTDADRARGVVTYSSGNHAQAVARAARLRGASVHAVVAHTEVAGPSGVDVEQVSLDRGDARRQFGLGGVTDQGAHVGAALHEVFDNMAADGAGRADNENGHGGNSWFASRDIQKMLDPLATREMAC